MNCSLPGVPRFSHPSAASWTLLQGSFRKSIIHRLIVLFPVTECCPVIRLNVHIIPSYLISFFQTAAFWTPHNLFNLSQSFPGLTAVQQCRDYSAVKKFQFCAGWYSIFIPEFFLCSWSTSCHAISDTNFFLDVAIFTELTSQVKKMFKLLDWFVRYTNLTVAIGSDTRDFSLPCVDSKPHLTSLAKNCFR